MFGGHHPERAPDLLFLRFSDAIREALALPNDGLAVELPSKDINALVTCCAVDRPDFDTRVTFAQKLEAQPLECLRVERL
jgi:hypothetical protein